MVEIQEGTESADWWTLLGGKEKYPTHLLPIRREPRLFACSAASGMFAVEEICPYAQVLIYLIFILYLLSLVIFKNISSII